MGKWGISHGHCLHLTLPPAPYTLPAVAPEVAVGEQRSGSGAQWRKSHWVADGGRGGYQPLSNTGVILPPQYTCQRHKKST